MEVTPEVSELKNKLPLLQQVLQHQPLDSGTSEQKNKSKLQIISVRRGKIADKKF